MSAIKGDTPEERRKRGILLVRIRERFSRRSVDLYFSGINLLAGYKYIHCEVFQTTPSWWPSWLWFPFRFGEYRYFRVAGIRSYILYKVLGLNAFSTLREVTAAIAERDGDLIMIEQNIDEYLRPKSLPHPDAYLTPPS